MQPVLQVFLKLGSAEPSREGVSEVLRNDNA